MKEKQPLGDLNPVATEAFSLRFLTREPFILEAGLGPIPPVKGARLEMELLIAASQDSYGRFS
jgi:hypothetical protein